MHRYFFEIAFDGADYCGWQRQPNGISVQSTIEDLFSLIFRNTIKIVGCGRTDAGVHASQFYFHVDLSKKWDNTKLFGLNNMLPKNISIQKVIEVEPNAHARFDALKRSYEYHIHAYKSPFMGRFSSLIQRAQSFDLDQLNACAAVFLNYSEFFPFCKAHSDAKTMKCEISQSVWKKTEKGFVYHISANRFLRGMVRLIVGAHLNVIDGKIALIEIEDALQNQIKLDKNLSAPAEGLRLSEVVYPYISG